MERFGKDVDELFISSGRSFDITTVFMLGLRVVSTSMFYYNQETSINLDILFYIFV